MQRWHTFSLFALLLICEGDRHSPFLHFCNYWQLPYPNIIPYFITPSLFPFRALQTEGQNSSPLTLFPKRFFFPLRHCLCRQKTSDFLDFPDIWSLFYVYFYAGCLEAEKKHTWVQYFQYFSSFLYFSHTHLFWGFNLFDSYWCSTFEKKVTLIWIIYRWS